MGPDCLRTNVLLELLVHMSKRDAFNTLRTQQQVRGGGVFGGRGGGGGGGGSSTQDKRQFTSVN